MESAPAVRKRRRSNHSNHRDEGHAHLGSLRRRSSSSGPYDITFNEPDIPLPDSSLWYDAPLIVAILPCLGALLFGTDLQEMMLFFCICWYLHTCLRLPWSLYEMSRPRAVPRHEREKMTPAQLAAEEKLQRRSMILLAIAFVAPFGGLILIRRILKVVGAADNGPYVTYFHGALFVLFGGVRPINHVASLIMGGTRELQGKVHHPPTDTEAEDLSLKVERMEIILSTLTEKFRNVENTQLEDTAKKQIGMLEVQDTFEKTASRLEDGAKRREKKAEMAFESMDRRVEGLEKQYEALLSMTLNQNTNGSSEPTLRGLMIKWFDWIDEFWSSWIRWRQRPQASGSPNGYSPTGSRFDTRRSNGSSRSSGTSVTAASLVRRRSHDASPNLDTVVEEEQETEEPVVLDTAIPVVDLNGTNGTTGGARDTRRRARVVNALEGQSSTNGNGSQFLRVPSEAKHRKRSIQQTQQTGAGIGEG